MKYLVMLFLILDVESSSGMFKTNKATLSSSLTVELVFLFMFNYFNVLATNHFG